MDLDLIELNKGCPQCCCVIKDDECDQLKESFVIDAVDDELFVLTGKFALSHFLQYATGDGEYFVIRNIHKAPSRVQSMYLSLIKDRYLNSCGSLVDDFTFVLTVDNEESLSKIIPELYHLCVVCL